jgi:hypothetical protein
MIDWSIFDWWQSAWKGIEGLQGGAPQFLGALTGSSLGLIGILLGALYNARLNRKRDDRLRRNDTLSTITVLRAELNLIKFILTSGADNVEQGDVADDIYVPNVSDLVRMFPKFIDKIGLLDEDVVRAVTAAVLLVDMHAIYLSGLDGSRVEQQLGRMVIVIPAAQAEKVTTSNRVKAREIQDAIEKLDQARQRIGQR